MEAGTTYLSLENTSPPSSRRDVGVCMALAYCDLSHEAMECNPPKVQAVFVPSRTISLLFLADTAHLQMLLSVYSTLKMHTFISDEHHVYMASPWMIKKCLQLL